MADAPFSPILRFFRVRPRADGGAEPSDRQLLTRFARGRDEAAFAALVRRHGPLVPGVCRRVPGNADDAEDAFRATFLVLSRRAGSVAWRPSVGNCLHETAYRLARKLRAADYRRRARELAPRTEGGSAVSPAWRELRHLLADELRRLPRRERSTLPAGYLEDQTQDEAARQLVWSLRTLQRRLARGRGLLRARLVRRGLPLPTAFLAGALIHDALAAEAAETARAAAVFAAGGTPGVRATALLVVGCVVLLSLGLVGLRRLSLWPEDEEIPPATAAPPIAHGLADDEGNPLPDRAVSRLGTPRLRHEHPDFTADGKSVVSADAAGNFSLWDVASGWRIRRPRTAPRQAVDPVAVAISGDGRTIAWGDRGTVHIAPVDGEGGPVSWMDEKQLAGGLQLSPDGKIVLVRHTGAAVTGQVATRGSGLGENPVPSALRTFIGCTTLSRARSVASCRSLALTTPRTGAPRRFRRTGRCSRRPAAASTSRPG